MSDPQKTHEDLMPPHACPSLLMKHILTNSKKLQATFSYRSIRKGNV